MYSMIITVTIFVQSGEKTGGQGDFPFYYVQIAPYKYKDPDATD